MSKRTRLEIYDPYPSDVIAEAIERWIKNHLQRRILHLMLVESYSYREAADMLNAETGNIYDEKTLQRAVYRAENILFPHLKVVYRPDNNND